jgi:hypothetical protein
MLQDYLEEEFESLTPAVRTYVKFLSSKKIMDELQNVTLSSCSCDNKTLPTLHTDKKKKGTLHTYECSSCGQTTTASYSESVARASWVSKGNGSDPFMLFEDTLAARISNVQSSSDYDLERKISNLLHFRGNLSFYEKVRNIHKKQSSFKLLTKDEQFYLECISLHLKASINELTSALTELGFVLSDDASMNRIEGVVSKLKSERLLALPRFIERLNEDYSVAYEAFLNS